MPRAKAPPPVGPCPSSPPPRPARRSRATTCRAAQDDDGEPREEEHHCAPRRERPAKRKQAADGGPAAQAEGASDGSPWPALPHTVLCAVLSLLDHEDVVSAGQTCRSWRQAARHRDVWRRRELQYQVTDHRSPHFSNDWHRNARRFSRIARFAPCAATVCCNRGMLPAARKALFTQSQCQPKAVELNGATVAAEKYLKKWQEFIEDVTLLNPSPGSLRAAVNLPKLTSLSVKFKFDSYNREYEVPSLRGPGSTTLKNLTLHRRVHFSGVDSLLRAHATTLEDVSAYCFPSEALSVCTALRRLAIEVDPETDGQRLLKLLRAVNPLERLDFQSDGAHDGQACSALRGRIKDEGLALRDVGCNSCERGGPVVLDYHRMRGWPA